MDPAAPGHQQRQRGMVPCGDGLLPPQCGLALLKGWAEPLLCPSFSHAATQLQNYEVLAQNTVLIMLDALCSG